MEMERIDTRGHRKNLALDGIRTHDPPCSRSDALTSELLRTRCVDSLHLPLFPL